MIELKPTTTEDLETLFEHQVDDEYNTMAASTSENPNDKAAYITKWTKNIANPTINMQTIFMGSKIAGSVLHFDMMGETNVSYGIDKNMWGKGIASEALREFIKLSPKRPLYGRVAFDNVGSQKVLEKCGFKRIGKAKEFANARQQEIEEFIYILE